MLPQAFIHLLPRDKSLRLDLIGILLHTTKDFYMIDVDEKDSLIKIGGFLKELSDDGITYFFVTVGDELSVLPRITFRVDLLGKTTSSHEILKSILEKINKNIN